MGPPGRPTVSPRRAYPQHARAHPYPAAMGFLELTDVTYRLPGGWTLFEGVSFRAGDGAHAALVGANGIGKTTLLKLIAGDEPVAAGSIRVDGRVGLMRQFIGSEERPTTVREFL